MSNSVDSQIITAKDTSNLLKRRAEWREKSWSIPDLRGGKQNWFRIVRHLVELIGSGKNGDLDSRPEIAGIVDPRSWRTYAGFLKGVGLVRNQAGLLKLSETGEEFNSDPTQRHLADILQEQVRLFAEVLNIIHTSAIAVEAVDEYLQKTYALSWANLNNTRRRMDWLEVLGLIESVGDRKWGTTAAGIEALKHWSVISPAALEAACSEHDIADILEPPTEIAILLQELVDTPEAHRKRSTYNIWVPSPNRIDNLRKIVQVASERISKLDLFAYISNEFHLKKSSVESMLPFLRAASLVDEVGKGIYLATPAAKAWLETGNDFDFIRILHANMRFVGEMIKTAKNDVTRNEIYAEAGFYGLNIEKARWIAGFLIESCLLEEPRYLHLRATPTGIKFAETLPIESKPANCGVEALIVSESLNDTKKEIDVVLGRLIETSRGPVAEGEASGIAFEKAIAAVFRFLGFDAERIGGSGDTDVVVRWRNSDGISAAAIVDGKSKTGGFVSHTDISDVAIDAHKYKNNADYVGIVGPDFSGDTIRNYARKKGYALITVGQLDEVVRAAEQIGLSLEELSLLFQTPNGISRLLELITSRQRELEIMSSVVSKISRDQSTLDGLSPRDLFFMLRDTNISPSLEELIGAIDIISKSEIGVLRVVDVNQDASKTTYMLSEAKMAVNHLRAIAKVIDNALRE
jgi:hypothetical protein